MQAPRAQAVTNPVSLSQGTLRYPASSVLLIATRQIGDVLLATPLLRSLRRAYTESRIDVLVYRDKGGMLEGNPDLDRMIEVDEHPDCRGYRELLRAIFRRYELVVTTQGGDRAILYSLLAGRRRFGIVPTLARKYAWKRALLRGWTLLDNLYTHTVIQNLRLADLLGIDRCYQVVPPRSLGSSSRVLGGDGAYLVFHPYPMWRYKRWTRVAWESLIRYTRSRGLGVVVSGGPAEEDLCEDLARGFRDPRVSSVAGRLGFGELADLLSGAMAYVGPDTAVTHLAAACGIPTIALYGPSNPMKWGPWPAQHVQCESSPYLNRSALQRVGNVCIIQGLGECVPCHQEGCERHKGSYSRCLDELDPGRVLAVLDGILTQARGGTTPGR